MARLLSVPAGRRAKWVVLALWLVVLFGASAANLPGKFADDERNESTSFLPGDAESTKALAATKKITGGENVAALVVFRRDGGLTAADQARIRADLPRLEPLRARYPQLVPQRDGRVFRLASISPDRTTRARRGRHPDERRGSTILDPVDDIRDLVSDPGGGLQVKVTGGAGFSADAIKVFQNINGTLLLVGGGARVFLLIIIYRSPIFWLIPIFAVLGAELLLALPGLRPDRGGHHRQRAVVVDPLGARARRGHRLRAAARGPLPRGAAPPRGQARGDAPRAAPRGPGDLRLGRDRGRWPCCPCRSPRSTAPRAWARSARWGSSSRWSRC